MGVASSDQASIGANRFGNQGAQRARPGLAGKRLSMKFSFASFASFAVQDCVARKNPFRIARASFATGRSQGKRQDLTFGLYVRSERRTEPVKGTEALVYAVTVLRHISSFQTISLVR